MSLASAAKNEDNNGNHCDTDKMLTAVTKVDETYRLAFTDEKLTQCHQKSMNVSRVDAVTHCFSTVFNIICGIMTSGYIETAEV